MKIVLINHTHPEARHVSALRMREFAKHLSAAGDQAVLLTGPLRSDDPGDDPTLVEARIEAHDWSTPMHIATTLVETPVRRAAREGRVLSPVRQVLLGATYFFCGGVFCDWRAGSTPFLKPIANTFRPDLVYGTFGNTDAWFVARDLAGKAKCPWVADYKDPWDKFVPIGLRRNVASRFADFEVMTVFSQAHALDASGWFPSKKEVVYSGYRVEPNYQKPTANNDVFRVCLSGSVYSSDSVRVLLEGMSKALSSRASILCYAGNDGENVGRIIHQAGIPVEFGNLGYLDFYAFARVQVNASVNVYIRNEQSLFQQKFIELLAFGRPIIAIPGESAEASNIAAEVGGQLIGAETSAEIASALSDVVSDQTEIDLVRLRSYSWSSQTEKLRQIFADVAGGYV
ncbi:MAG: hypothetical protein VX700_12860 [Pseudomonadota bacterium]|nr:hypothetical protein [Pseudomonadota bacterium]